MPRGQPCVAGQGAIWGASLAQRKGRFSNFPSIQVRGLGLLCSLLCSYWLWSPSTVGRKVSICWAGKDGWWEFHRGWGLTDMGVGESILNIGRNKSPEKQTE